MDSSDEQVLLICFELSPGPNKKKDVGKGNIEKKNRIRSLP